MRNTLITTWVKNVYSLFIGKGINSVHSPTVLLSNMSSSHITVHKHLIFPRFILTFTSQLSTKEIVNLPLLKYYLSPLSTPLITMNTLGKLKGINSWNSL